MRLKGRGIEFLRACLGKRSPAPGRAAGYLDSARVDRGVGCLAERDAVRRASLSRSCGGPRGTPAGRLDRRDRKS